MTDNYADLFVLHDGIYLLNHSVGRPPKSLQKALSQSFFQCWESGDAEVWPQWIQQIERFRIAVAKLLNAQFADVCPQVNLSSALTKVIHSLPVSNGRNTVLFHQQDFPSMGFVLQRAQRLGYVVRMIPADSDPQDIDVWRSHIDHEVALVLITHVHSNTSKLLPVAEVASYARARGAFSVVDIAQSVGVVPIAVPDWHADFVLGSCVKWLCGGPGAGFLWVNPDVVEQCDPLDVGWFSHENPFEFDITDFRLADGAMRFWGGTPSVLPYAMAAISIELIDGVGVETIRAHNLALMDALLSEVDPSRVQTPTDQRLRGGSLILNFTSQQAQVERRLHKASVRFDTRPNGLRLSPHIYNSHREIEIVAECLKI